MDKKVQFLGMIMLIAVLLLAACGNNNTDGNSSNNIVEADEDLGDTDITIPYVAWADYEARLHVLAEVLEQEGYDVELTEVEAGPMFTSIADGTADFTAMWLPSTHEEYWDEYEGDIEKGNEVLDEAPLSFAVPDYMADDVQSIEDLKDNEELGESVDWTITGIDPGAGIMDMSESAIDEYDLDNWDLQESSEAAMLATVEDSIDAEEPIIFTGWEPHFMFGKWDLELLDDPEGIFGGDGDQIYLVSNNDLEEDSPAAYQTIEQYTEDYDMLNELMADMEDGDPETVAEEFVEENEDLVEEWTEGIE